MIAVITGASSGIGRETASLMVSRGHVVYDLSRSDKPQEGVIHIHCDVTNRETVRNAMREIESRHGRIDILVLCAGMGVAGSVEHTSDGDMMRQFDVNTFGPVRVLQEALPLIRRPASDNSPVHKRVVFVSSMAAAFGIPFQAMYSATKAALNSFAFSLCNELCGSGIGVTVVMPGDVKTSFKRSTDLAGSDVYPEMAGAIAQMERDEANGLSAVAVARKVVRASLRRRVSLYYTSDFMSDIQCFLQRILPTSVALYVVRKLYLHK